MASGKATSARTSAGGESGPATSFTRGASSTAASRSRMSSASKPHPHAVTATHTAVARLHISRDATDGAPPLSSAAWLRPPSAPCDGALLAMETRRTAWHYFLDILLREKGSRAFEYLAEEPLTRNVQHLD